MQALYRFALLPMPPWLLSWPCGALHSWYRLVYYTTHAEQRHVKEPGWLAGIFSLPHLGTSALLPDNGNNCTVSTSNHNKQIPVSVMQMANYCDPVRSNTRVEVSEEKQHDSPLGGRAGNQISIPQSHTERSN